MRGRQFEALRPGPLSCCRRRCPCPVCGGWVVSGRNLDIHVLAAACGVCECPCSTSLLHPAQPAPTKRPLELPAPTHHSQPDTRTRSSSSHRHRLRRLPRLVAALASVGECLRVMERGVGSRRPISGVPWPNGRNAPHTLLKKEEETPGKNVPCPCGDHASFPKLIMAHRHWPTAASSQQSKPALVLPSFPTPQPPHPSTHSSTGHTRGHHHHLQQQHHGGVHQGKAVSPLPLAGPPPPPKRSSLPSSTALQPPPLPQSSPGAAQQQRRRARGL